MWGYYLWQHDSRKPTLNNTALVKSGYTQRGPYSVGRMTNKKDRTTRTAMEETGEVFSV
jgi:hypothetical protein